MRSAASDVGLHCLRRSHLKDARQLCRSNAAVEISEKNVKTIKNWTPEKIAVIILKFYHTVMCPKDAEGLTNIVDSDQTALHSGQSLHCLPRPVYLNTWDHYSTL